MEHAPCSQSLQPLAAPVIGGTTSSLIHILIVTSMIVTGQRGETLLVWTEGSGWNKGGAVTWQVFDADGQPTSEQGTRDGLPVWGLASAYVKPGGNFVVVYRRRRAEDSAPYLIQCNNGS